MAFDVAGDVEIDNVEFDGRLAIPRDQHHGLSLTEEE
jgi:hypothetical protein